VIPLALVDQPAVEIGHHSSIDVFGIAIYTDTVVMTALVLALIGGLIYWAHRRGITEGPPTGVQNVLEYAVEFVSGLVEDTIGERGRRIAPVVITLFLFILISNWVGLIALPGVHFTSPTADLNSTLALALITFVLIHFFSVQAKGWWGYLKHYAEPHPFFIPINLIDELSKPLTLSFRLFGNILAGEVMLGVLLYFAGGFLLAATALLHGHLLKGALGLSGLILVMVFNVGWLAFSVFVGAIQAFIFTMLTIAYLGRAMEHHEPEHSQKAA
jgi:F-type H+-transporting ATPase subunit a